MVPAEPDGCVDGTNKEIPDVLFWFTYREKKIVFQGVSSDMIQNKEEYVDYSERFKNGTLLE